jgi:hypothetical protein
MFFPPKNHLFQPLSHPVAEDFFFIYFYVPSTFSPSGEYHLDAFFPSLEVKFLIFEPKIAAVVVFLSVIQYASGELQLY